MRTLTLNTILCTAAAALLLPLAASAQDAHGTWTITTRADGNVHLETRWRSDDGIDTSNNSSDVDAGKLGITDALRSGGEHATFWLRRDAGNFRFDGWLSHGSGGGNFDFTPNDAFFASLRNRGYQVNGINDEMATAELDITSDYITSMERLGYKPDLHGLFAMRALRITPEYVSALHNAGLTGDDAHSIVSLKAVGVTGAYVNDIAQAGYSHLSAHQYTELRAMHIDGAFIRYLAAHGYKNLPIQRIVEMKAVGIDRP